MDLSNTPFDPSLIPSTSTTTSPSPSASDTTTKTAYQWYTELRSLLLSSFPDLTASPPTTSSIAPQPQPTRVIWTSPAPTQEIKHKSISLYEWHPWNQHEQREKLDKCRSILSTLSTLTSAHLTRLAHDTPDRIKSFLFFLQSTHAARSRYDSILHTLHTCHHDMNIQITNHNLYRAHSIEQYRCMTSLTHICTALSLQEMEATRDAEGVVKKSFASNNFILEVMIREPSASAPQLIDDPSAPLSHIDGILSITICQIRDGNEINLVDEAYDLLTCLRHGEYIAIYHKLQHLIRVETMYDTYPTYADTLHRMSQHMADMMKHVATTYGWIWKQKCEGPSITITSDVKPISDLPIIPAHTLVYVGVYLDTTSNPTLSTPQFAHVFEIHPPIPMSQHVVSAMAYALTHNINMISTTTLTPSILDESAMESNGSYHHLITSSTSEDMTSRYSIMDHTHLIHASCASSSPSTRERGLLIHTIPWLCDNPSSTLLHNIITTLTLCIAYNRLYASCFRCELNAGICHTSQHTHTDNVTRSDVTLPVTTFDIHAEIPHTITVWSQHPVSHQPLSVHFRLATSTSSLPSLPFPGVNVSIDIEMSAGDRSPCSSTYAQQILARSISIPITMHYILAKCKTTTSDGTSTAMSM